MTTSLEDQAMMCTSWIQDLVGISSITAIMIVTVMIEQLLTMFHLTMSVFPEVRLSIPIT